MLHDEKWTLSWRPYGLGCPSLRLGAGRGQRAVFFGGVTVTAATANGVRWETRSVLVAALSHFSELETKLELLRSGHNTDLMEDQVDALWI
jgi:hypothetical protein